MQKTALLHTDHSSALVDLSHDNMVLCILAAIYAVMLISGVVRWLKEPRLR